MRFSPRLPNDTATLLLVCVFIIVLIGLADAAHDPASHHTETSRSWGRRDSPRLRTWLRQYLRSDHPRPRSSAAITAHNGRVACVRGDAGGVRLGLVHPCAPAGDTHAAHLGAFAGLVIVAIAGNAVENVSGIVLAAKGRSELAISVVKNSVAQIAAFLYPLLVLVSLLTAISLTFALAPVYIGRSLWDGRDRVADHRRRGGDDLRRARIGQPCS